ncbi:hypothetical protein CRI77_02780 [Mycolicibacterium duvalii]|uniref:Uncharacterized protein n=1 Tax=Mycolicibacterium duvalii TaxID=39688 RepID=A0A7I7JXZ8_9MYCO|nr:hypothetical protein [Mycolicibacterium duvalii]MCV7366778.1 hypothetical protein [Mycolicibacterium duvalii]PEG43910.1 hypothetical protein CRI77_02780 [Mycolicibacterium duvalii]BBX16760.1 hypothetical protein MDUV_16200 [Mycolicibacterium duvalii]
MTATPKTSVRPRRLDVRRRLLIWSIPILVLMCVLAVKLASVWVLGNRLPGQFAERDKTAMTSTLRWLNAGWFGGGFRAQLADGDRLMLQGDLAEAHTKFRAAHLDSPGACPPRVNFALISEVLSNEQLRAGSFFQAREMLEPAAQAAAAQPHCFGQSPSSVPEIRLFVEQTPERLTNKLTALKNGWLTETAEGYDYLRTPGGGIDFSGSSVSTACPFADDDLRLKECIKNRDAEREQKVRDAQAKEDAEDAPPPAAEPPPPPPPGEPPPPPAPAPRAPDPAEPQFPGTDNNDDPTAPGFCTPDGTPLQDLGALLCTTAGPMQ